MLLLTLPLLQGCNTLHPCVAASSIDASVIQATFTLTIENDTTWWAEARDIAFFNRLVGPFFPTTVEQAQALRDAAQRADRDEDVSDFALPHPAPGTDLHFADGPILPGYIANDLYARANRFCLTSPPVAQTGKRITLTHSMKWDQKHDGLIVFSAPAYSRDGQTAVVSVTRLRGSNEGMSYLVFLRVIGGRWQVTERVTAAIY